MLTDEEKRKIYEEEQLRLQIRKEYYSRPIIRPFIGKVLLFFFIWGTIFFALAIILSLLFRQNESMMLGVIFGSLGVSLVGTIMVFNKIFKQKYSK